MKLELHAIGEELTVVVDGQKLGTVRDSRHLTPGNPGIFADSAAVRDIEYVPLDKPGAAAATTSSGAPTDSGQPPSPAAEPGFRSLFDGKTLNGWRSWRSATPPTECRVVDGVITATPKADLVSNEEFEDFELRLEWKVDAKGNGGIHFRIPAASGAAAFPTEAPEFQLLRSTYDGPANMRTGALFKAAAAITEFKGAANQWHTATLIVRGGKGEHWIDGDLYCRYDLASEALQAEVRTGRLGEGFGQPAKGRIGLQFWEGETAYRNIRIRPLAPATTATTAPGASETSRDWIADMRAERKHTGFGFEDDGTFVRSPNSTGAGWSPISRDGAIRATWKLSSEVPSVGQSEPSISLRKGGPGDGPRATYGAVIAAKEVRLDLHTWGDGRKAERRELGRWPLPAGFDRTQEHTFEFRAVGDLLTISLNDQQLGTMRDRSATEGSFGFFPAKGAAIRKMEYVSLDPPASAVPENLAPATPKPATPKAVGATPPPTDSGVIDLLALVDVKRDGIAGEWKLVNGELLGSGNGFARLEFAYAPPDEYDALPKVNVVR